MRDGPGFTRARHNGRGGSSSEQHRQESLRALAKRCGINPKTVAKGKTRSPVADLPTGPGEARSTVLSLEDEALIVAFRRHTLLPPDDCLYALPPAIPRLTRSSRHRCLQRHGLSRLPGTEGDKPPKKTFKRDPTGYFRVDIAQVQTAEGKLQLFVAIDRTSKFALARLEESAAVHAAAAFLKAPIEAAPGKIHTVPTGNGSQFCDLPSRRNGPAARLRLHRFDRVGRQNAIERRLTKPNHPWTNGQVERMNRTVKEATVKRFHDDSHSHLRQHLQDFIDADTFARRLKTLKGLTPYEFMCKRRASDPNRFIFNPIHRNPGSNA